MRGVGRILGVALKIAGVAFAVFPIVLAVIGKSQSVMGIIFTIPIGLLIWGTGSLIFDYAKNGKIQTGLRDRTSTGTGLKSSVSPIIVVGIIVIILAVVLLQPSW